jgi:hypothetical protein
VDSVLSKSDIVKRVLSIALFLLIFSSVLYLNFKTPMIGEDYALSLTYFEKHNQPIPLKLSLIYEKVRFQFLNWNSRIGEQLSILSLGFDKAIFNILNGIVFTCLCAINVRFGLGETKFKNIEKLLVYTSLAMMLYLVFLPALGESVFWLTGSTNYLWGITILLIFLLSYVKIFETPGKAEQKLHPLLLFVAFFAGMSNENTVSVSIIFCIFVLIKLRLEKKPVNITYYLALIFHLLGYAVLLFSPSTYIRRAYYNQVFGIVKLSFPMLISRLLNILAIFYHHYKIYLFVTLLLFLCYLAIQIASRKKLSLSNSRPLTLFLFMLLAFISLFDMVVVPYYEVRSSLLIFIAMTTLIISIIDSFRSSNKPIFIFFIILLSAVWLVSYNSMRITYNSFYAEFRAREDILFSVVDNTKTISVPPFSEILDQRVLNTRESYLIYNNAAFSRYYGFEEITIE